TGVASFARLRKPSSSRSLHIARLSTAKTFLTGIPLLANACTLSTAMTMAVYFPSGKEAERWSWDDEAGTSIPEAERPRLCRRVCIRLSLFSSESRSHQGALQKHRGPSRFGAVGLESRHLGNQFNADKAGRVCRRLARTVYQATPLLTAQRPGTHPRLCSYPERKRCGHRHSDTSRVGGEH